MTRESLSAKHDEAMAEVRRGQRERDREQADLDRQLAAEAARRGELIEERRAAAARERPPVGFGLSPDPRVAGPRAALQPIAIPGFRAGLNITLDLSRGRERAQAYLHPGIVAVRGQFVHVHDRKRLAQSDVDWTTRVPGTVYYVYLSSNGEVKVDAREPRYNREHFDWSHPVFADWVAIGHLWLGLQDQVLLAVPDIRRRVEVTVASSVYPGPADYYCDARDDEREINAAALYLSQRNGGGAVRLTAGVYTTGAQVLLRGAVVYLEGVGQATVVRGGWATGDAGTTSGVLVNLEARADDSDELGPEGDAGAARMQIRDLRLCFGEDDQTCVDHFGWGATLEAGGNLQADVEARFPSLLIGPLGEDQTDTGAEQVFADGDKLVLRRANGSAWRDNLVLEAGEGIGVDPAVTLENLAGTYGTVLRTNRIIVGGRISSGGLIAAPGANGAIYAGGVELGAGGFHGGTLTLTGKASAKVLETSGFVRGGSLVTGGTLHVSGKALLGGGVDVTGTLKLDTLADVKAAIQDLYTWAREVVKYVNNTLRDHTHTFHLGSWQITSKPVTVQSGGRNRPVNAPFAAPDWQTAVQNRDQIGQLQNIVFPAGIQ